MALPTAQLFPQAGSSGLATRTRDDQTALYSAAAPPRSTKRHATQVNYAEYDAELAFLDEDDEENGTASATASVNPNPASVLVTPAAPDPLAGMPANPVAARVTPHVPGNPALIVEQCSQPDVMVPIRLNIEHTANNGLRIVDFFLWNLHEQFVTPDLFASIMCSDLDLPQSVEIEIIKLIRLQLEEYAALATWQLATDLPLRAIVNILVLLDKQLYLDRFEWSLTEQQLTPEKFALIVVADMGLLLEFKPAIAHAIYEAVLRLKKDLTENSFAFEPDTHVYRSEAALAVATVPPTAGLRTDVDGSRTMNGAWEPVVEILTQWEMEKREIERERNLRRLKRETIKMGHDDGKRRSKRGRDDW